METSVTIEGYTDDLESVLDLLQMSMGLESLDGVRQLMAIEKTRGTRYYVAKNNGQVIGLVGVWFDPTGASSELEPPQIIDLAVHPEHRRRGIARDLINTAIRETQAAGHHRLWLYTDGNNIGLLSFYRKLGFRLASVVPDWFGDGSVKAIFRLDFEDREG
jgi:ribosomal protein S18 acetylase RimI-like enzyme